MDFKVKMCVAGNSDVAEGKQKLSILWKLKNNFTKKNFIFFIYLFLFFIFYNLETVIVILLLKDNFYLKGEINKNFLCFNLCL